METLGVVVLLAALPILFFLTAKVKAEKDGELRVIPALKELPGSVGRAAETGQAVHVSVGVAGVGGVATAETWAGLTLLQELAKEAAACDVPLVVTVADPSVLPIAQNILRRAYLQIGNPDGYDPTQVRFVAPEPLAYATGVMGILGREPLAGNVMVGAFGDEFLLMGETAADKGVHQIAGTSNPQTLPFVSASSDRALLGEEIFAGGAYTSKLPIQIGSLLAADWMRWIVIAAIILLAILKFLTQ